MYRYFETEIIRKSICSCTEHSDREKLGDKTAARKCKTQHQKPYINAECTNIG